MPIYEYVCRECSAVSEHIVIGASDEIRCSKCGSIYVTRLLSIPSSASGVKSEGRMPGAGDTACCGSRPGSQGCVPGSCCGKA